MNEEKREAMHSEIIYEEGWRGREPETDDVPPVDETAPDSSRRGSFPLLITIRLILCLIGAAVLFVMRAMDSDAYHGFMSVYKAEMNKPLISQELFRSLGPAGLASRDEVSVRASTDELPAG